MHDSLLAEGGQKASIEDNENDLNQSKMTVYTNKTRIKDIIDNLPDKVNTDLFTFKTNPLYIPADLDSEDENFKDYAESKNLTG